MTTIHRLLASLALMLGLCGAAIGQTLQVVTEETPYTFMRNGKVAGSATEVVEKALQRAGVADYRINIYPWARAYDMARNEPNVLIFLIARTPAREAQFQWLGEFMKMEYHVYKLKDNTEVVVHQLADARAYVTGVVRDDLRHQYLQSKGFTKLVVSAQNSDNFRKLVNRQIQLIPLPEQDKHVLCEELKFDCAKLEKVLTLDELGASLYLATGPQTPQATAERVRAGFSQIKAEGTVRKLMSAKP
jgi:polar amino acid transport system substrate-binding protein